MADNYGNNYFFVTSTFIGKIKFLSKRTLNKGFIYMADNYSNKYFFLI